MDAKERLAPLGGQSVAGENTLAPQGPLSAALSTQEKELMVLAEMLGSLRSKLQPLLMQIPQDVNKSDDPQTTKGYIGSSDYCVHVENNTGAVREMQRMVTGLANTLEV